MLCLGCVGERESEGGVQVRRNGVPCCASFLLSSVLGSEAPSQSLPTETF